MLHPDRITILLADDHAIFRGGVANLLRQEPDFEIVGEAGDGRQALELWKSLRPSVALLDLRMPGLDGIELVTQIRSIDAEAKTILLTTYEAEEDIVLALRAGARAYLLKDVRPHDLILSVRDVYAGRASVSPVIASKLAERLTQIQLTVRELRVLRLLAQGKANKIIAKELEISVGTVKVHTSNLFQKLGVSSRTEAIAAGIKRGLVRQ